jgi:hypothetical protein
VEKIGKNNQKAIKIGQVMSQMFAPRLEHNKIQTHWALDIPLENMLNKV